jgi:hypothetical protein
VDVTIDARPRVTSRFVTFTGVTGLSGDSEARWTLRSGWRDGGVVLGRVTSDDRQRHVRLRLNARGRACVVRPECRANLTVTIPEFADEDFDSSAYPLRI